MRIVGRTLIAASLVVAAGVAVNQIYSNGNLSWSWGYFALVFTVLGALVQAPQAAAPSTETTPSPPGTVRRRGGSRREYLRRMRSAVDQMETIGLVTQAEFVLRTRQVYVDVRLRPRTVSDVVTDTGIGPGSNAEAGRRASLASFLTGGRVLAVLGAAGSGKTTLARHTALEMVERPWSGWRRRGWLPVLLYLRDHAEGIQAEEPDGLARIAAAEPWLNGAVSVEWMEQRLARGQCLVLLDGLDEVADARDRSRVVQWVEEQISRYPDNAFVVTSRPLGYEGNRLSSADVLHVQRFTSRQIRDFLHAWYRAIERRSREGDPQEIDRIAAQAANDLFQRISGRPTLYDMAANPLLLTMIANVHRYRGSLPGSRAALYEEVCQVLLHRRQEAKNLTGTEPDGLSGLSGEKKERVVQELAWYMMRRNLRDIPAEEAERAVRAVLQRTAPDVSPETFLLHVKRSGLLLEHQYGRYGFAHLTLQEYLAAALVPGHASRRQLLVDNVSDPGWRETTLLWAARADASPVVEACLDARTVPALSLAYACLDEAREVDLALRERLETLLATTPSDPDEIRLLDGVAAARALQDTHALDDAGTRICANPVPHELWARYAAHTHERVVPFGPEDGLWAAEIEGFLTWLNSLFGDGASYRLPTPSEASHALSSDLVPRDGTSLYAADDAVRGEPSEMRFITAAPDQHPYRPTPLQIDAYPGLILDHTHFIFRLLRPSSSRLTFRELAAYVGPRDLTQPEHRLLHTVDLALDLALAVSHDSVTHRLTLDRVLESARGLDLDLGFSNSPGADDFGHAFSNALIRTLDHARTLNREIGAGFTEDDFTTVGVEPLARVLTDLLAREARRRGLNTDNHFALGYARDHDLDPALDRDLDRAIDRAIERALATIFARALAFAPTLDRARDLDRVLDRALARDRELARALASALDCTHALDRALDLDLDREPGRDRAVLFARALDRDRDLARTLAGTLNRDREFAFAFDHDRALRRALDRALGHDNDRVRALTRAFNLSPERAFVLDMAFGAAHRHGDNAGSGYVRDFALVRDLALAKARAADLDSSFAEGLAFARVVISSGFGSHDADAVVGTGLACFQLMRRFKADMLSGTVQGRQRGEEEASLSRFLDRRLGPAITWSPTADLSTALSRATLRAGYQGSPVMVPLIENAMRLAAPLWDRSRQVRQRDMVLAVTSVLAALTLTDDDALDEELAGYLRSALCTLIALTPETDAEPDGTTPTSKLLVLVRA
ncbi:NACHT domain-containing protein [Actinomadura sp. 7K507]|uniref:NACHT domain-containing protein n=1 Tax=Actinomadura sp. 7K507 TaxID=2530365 RepID=UPI00104E24FC|nr:NACHT domain-containing protein [Actinomadura sp. 7K507]TDC83515.1 NACHT domain-containing protein [Actinomadura sp. 7K507]